MRVVCCVERSGADADVRGLRRERRLGIGFGADIVNIVLIVNFGLMLTAEVKCDAYNRSMLDRCCVVVINVKHGIQNVKRWYGLLYGR